jgi:hypothetical protein
MSLAKDYAAQHKAEVDAGMWCYQCGALAGSLLGPLRPGHQRLCTACEALGRKDAAASHRSRLRCPGCRHQWDAYEHEGPSILDDGEHDVQCPECDRAFTIETTVSFSFESPKLGDQSDEEG